MDTVPVQELRKSDLGNTLRSLDERIIFPGGQLSQSNHFALQLPYVIFGLGQTPNFVDIVIDL